MTGATLYRQCRKAGIVLAVDGDGIDIDAPDGVTIPTDDLRRCKAELLALLNGDYLYAALELIRREVDPDRRDDLAFQFDERVAICELDGGLDQGKAEKLAYLELVKRLDSGRPLGVDRFHADNVAKADDLHVFRQRRMGLGGEVIERQASDETQAGIFNIHHSPIGQMQPQGNERLTIQFSGKRFGVHAQDDRPLNPCGEGGRA